MAAPVTMPSLPLFVRLAGRPVIALGAGDAAEAKRRLLERAGATIVGEDSAAVLAVVAIEDEEQAVAAVHRLRARGILVNAVDRATLCDFTLPAIVDRAPVLVAIGTDGVSAGLAAALRQRLETLLPAHLGALANQLGASRKALRERLPDTGERRRALGAALAAGGALDPLGDAPDVAGWLADPAPALARRVDIAVTSPDPDDLTLRQARALANADRVFHAADVPTAILDRARADAPRIASGGSPVDAGPGLSVCLRMA